jgi:hypothetical protein
MASQLIVAKAIACEKLGSNNPLIHYAPLQYLNVNNTNLSALQHQTVIVDGVAGFTIQIQPDAVDIIKAYGLTQDGMCFDQWIFSNNPDDTTFVGVNPVGAGLSLLTSRNFSIGSMMIRYIRTSATTVGICVTNTTQTIAQPVA